MKKYLIGLVVVILVTLVVMRCINWTFESYLKSSLDENEIEYDHLNVSWLRPSVEVAGLRGDFSFSRLQGRTANCSVDISYDLRSLWGQGIRINSILVSGDSISLKNRRIQESDTLSRRRTALLKYIDTTRTTNISIDFNQVNLKNKKEDFTLQSKGLSAEWEEVKLNDTVSFVPNKMHLSGVSIRKGNSYISIEEMHIGEDAALKLYMLKFANEGALKNNRLLYKVSVKDLLGKLTNHDHFGWNLASVEITEVAVGIEENGDIGLCNQLPQCELEELSTVINQLPYSGDVQVSGQLVYDYYKGGQIYSELEIQRFDVDLSKSHNGKFGGITKFNVHANIAPTIPVQWSGILNENGDFIYEIESDRFELTTLNAMIGDERDMEIVEGLCSNFKFEMEKRGDQLTCKMKFPYDNLRLKSQEKTWLARKFNSLAANIIVREESDGRMVHHYKRERMRTRSFFFNMGSSLEVGMKEIMVGELWSDLGMEL